MSPMVVASAKGLVDVPTFPCINAECEILGVLRSPAFLVGSSRSLSIKSSNSGTAITGTITGSTGSSSSSSRNSVPAITNSTTTTVTITGSTGIGSSSSSRNSTHNNPFRNFSLPSTSPSTTNSPYRLLHSYTHHRHPLRFIIIFLLNFAFAWIVILNIIDTLWIISHQTSGGPNGIRNGKKSKNQWWMQDTMRGAQKKSSACKFLKRWSFELIKGDFFFSMKIDWSKFCGCKRWCPKDLRVRAPAAPVLTHSL